jgi:hypothetical protein
MQKISNSGQITSQLLKNMRDLLDLTMLYIVKSEPAMNKHLFTLDILEN